jgi:hypothetical protein
MAAKVVQLIVLIAMIAAGFYGYRMYRDGQSSLEHVLAYLKTGTPIASTVCKITGGDFDYNISGTFYISGNKMRVDYYLSDRGIVNQAHAVVEDGTTLYLWSDTDDRAFKIPREQFFLTQYLEAAGDSCDPWLLPDESLFKVPVLVRSSAR